MPSIIEVSFKGNRKEFFLWDSPELPPVRAAVVVEADRGEDIGYVHATGDAAAFRVNRVAHSPGEEPITKSARRLATSDDVKRLNELREQDEQARRKAMERVRANSLQMKLTDAEWRWDRKKLTLYFTAEKRVDFRNLVRELASLFRTRIELKQIGVRDEAKRLGGIGRCGREYCSASWLPELRPVNLGVAKDQRLSLNPSQISGACGRLMCCLRYEHDFYVAQRRKFPKEGKLITTARGEEKVIGNDIFREQVTLRNSEGESRVIPLEQLRQEGWSAPAISGHPTAEPAISDEESAAIASEALPEEVVRLQDTTELPAWSPRSGHLVRRLPVIVEAEPEEQERRSDSESDDASAEDTGLDTDAEDDDAEDGEDDAADGVAGESSQPGAPGERPRGRRRRGRRGGRGRRRS